MKLTMLRRNPIVGLPAVPAVALTAAVVADWHSTLQFLGVSATLFTIALRVTSYSSPQVSFRTALHFTLQQITSSMVWVDALGCRNLI